jgi:hypothetical protein
MNVFPASRFVVAGELPTARSTFSANGQDVCGSLAYTSRVDAARAARCEPLDDKGRWCCGLRAAPVGSLTDRLAVGSTAPSGRQGKRQQSTPDPSQSPSHAPAPGLSSQHSDRGEPRSDPDWAGYLVLLQGVSPTRLTFNAPSIASRSPRSLTARSRPDSRRLRATRSCRSPVILSPPTSATGGATGQQSQRSTNRGAATRTVA